MNVGALWRMAVRNTVRHKSRTTITAAVMMIGIGVFIGLDSAFTGVGRIGLTDMADYSLSWLKIRDPAYVDDIEAAPLDKGLADPQAVVALLAAEGFAAAPRARFVARLSNYEDEIPVLADAVDPVADARVFRLAASVSSGVWLSGAPSRSVVLGARLAAELKLGVGDAVLVSARTVGDTTNADEYTVVGLVAPPVPEVNRNGLFMSLADARLLLDAPGLVTEVDAALPATTRLRTALAASDRAAARLRQAVPALRADPIGVLGRTFLDDVKWHASLLNIIIAGVLLIAAVGIVNTIFMSVFSRVREIGVLRAYGVQRREIALLFTFEGLIVGALGSLLGVALGVLLDFLLITWGIPLGAVAEARSGYFPGVLRGEWNPQTMIAGFVFGLAVSLIAALVPARRASRLEPTDALRFQ